MESFYHTNYCYNCNKEVELDIKNEDIRTVINNKEIFYKGKIAWCKECGEEVYNQIISDENIGKAHIRYNIKE